MQVQYVTVTVGRRRVFLTPAATLRCGWKSDSSGLRKCYLFRRKAARRMDLLTKEAGVGEFKALLSFFFFYFFK